MAFITDTITGVFWPPYLETEGLSSLCGIKNEGNVPVTIKYLYIRNIISNPQEELHNYSFCFTLKFRRQEIIDWYSDAFTGNLVTKKIPYPSFYSYQPGNETYSDTGLTDFKQNYIFPEEFVIPANNTFFFPILFTPQDRQVDFYRAELVIGYEVSYNTRELTNPISGLYAYSNPDVDNTESEKIMSLNGIPFGGLITLQ